MDKGLEAYSEVCKLFERLDEGESYNGEIADRLDELIAGPIFERLKTFRIIDRKNINIAKIKSTHSAQEYNEQAVAPLTVSEYENVKELLISK